MVDEAGAKVVAGEGEMHGRGYSTTYDATYKCWPMADLWGGKRGRM